jgi:hypothetical protein
VLSLSFQEDYTSDLNFSQELFDKKLQKRVVGYDHS